MRAAIRNEIERLAGSLGRPIDGIVEAKLQELHRGAFGAEPAAPTPEDVF